MAPDSNQKPAQSNPVLRGVASLRFGVLTLFWKVFPKIWSITPIFIRKPIKRIKTLWESRLVRRHQAALAALIQQHPEANPLIVFAPCLDWNVQLFQRPQQLALSFAHEGALVIYPQPKPNFKHPPFQEIIKNLYLGNVVIGAFDILDSPIVYVLTWNSGYLPNFKTPRVLYDYVDDIDVFYGDQKQIAQGHESLIQDAEIVVVTAERLRLGLQERRPEAVFCPNGVDYEAFSVSRSKESCQPPQDLAPLVAQGVPIIGYYGALARWFDYALVDRLCEIRKEYAFVFIGPDYDGTLRSQKMFQRPNVTWLGVKPYDELPAYLRYFDVATIPFVVNDITHATSPLKLFEYMAGGKPVVVTPMHESMRYPGVLVGGSAEEFAGKLDEALELRSDPLYLQTIDEVARSNTWNSRAAQILTALRERSKPA